MEISEIRKILRQRIRLEAKGNVAAWARMVGVEYYRSNLRQFVSGQIRKDGRQIQPPPDVLETLGLERVIVYRKKQQGPN